MPRTPRRSLFMRMVGLVVCLLSAGTAEAQYFGQNKVQYDSFAFEVLETEHFDIHYYPIESDAARIVGRMAERWYQRLSTLLDHQLSSRQPVFIYASHPEFEQTNVVEGMISEATGGVTEGGRRRVVLPLGASLGETDHVLGHELVHAFQYDILGPNIERAPLWFIEGMAEYLSIGPRHPQTAMWLRDAALQGALPEVRDLFDPRYFPYRFGHALWAYVGGRWGDGAVADALKRLSPIVDALTAVEMTAGMKQDEMSKAWHASIYDAYDITPPAEPVDDEDTDRVPPPALLAARTGSGSMNIGPALSPDGSRVAFLSERSRLSIDVYVADTETGQRVRRLTTSAVDPHFESLQFLASAGSWAPDNRRLVVATVQRGRGALSIFDTETGDVLRTIPLEQRGEMFQPSWSPDGSAIAFSAQIGGFTDLYVHTLADGATRRLTNDAFADLQPAWSPDGRSLAFVTERYNSSLDTLSFPEPTLALVDVATSRLTPVATGLRGQASSPQWSSDGAALLFISDHSGRPDIYRVTLATGTSEALTAEPTGIAGITPLSPALSVARAGSQAAFSVYRNGSYEIRLATGAPTPMAPSDDDVARLPPIDRPTSLVATRVHDAATGLPPTDAATTTRPYKPGLSLIGFGQSVGAVSSGTFGTAVAGGVSLLFSDMLGNHLVPIALDVNGSVRDVGAQASYINRTRRWNWGVFAAHVPLRSGYVSAGFDVSDGRPVYLEQTNLLRETTTELGGLVAYPFSRSTRIEFNTSVQRTGFGREVQTLAFDANTGQFLFEDTEHLDGFPSLYLANVGAALVRDRAAFGAVSPVLGQRFRFEVAPTFGDLSMTTTTLDFRQYAMPFRPVTFAGRAMHVGRYGSGSEDSRLYPLFLGYSTLVRGYDPNSFEPDECSVTGNGSCPEFDRLLGSRMFLFNGEIRVPAAGLFNGELDYGPIPTELFAFVDAGVAWTSTDKPKFAGGTRPWATSVGVGARVNAFGYLIAEFNLARALDRPRQGWAFVFNLRPGF